MRYDGTDRIDYAFEKNGGRVLVGRDWTTSPPRSRLSSGTAEASLAINVHSSFFLQVASQ